MPHDQVLIFFILVVALGLFIYGRIRYDVVALLALAACGVTGLVSPDELFSGFGHPAVITVAAVLVISYALINAGLVDALAGILGKLSGSAMVQLVALTALVAVCSAFMNNVGALAVLMPVAVQLARKHGIPVSLLLMPLAFGSLLGGLTTLIGTPPNIIIATFRADLTGTPFSMFDFTPVGLGVVLSGLAFIWLFGRRLLPDRTGKGSQKDLFDIEGYLTELRVPDESDWADRTVRELETVLSDTEVAILGIVRGERRLPVPSGREHLRSEDVLVVEADADSIKEFMDKTGFELNADEELSERFLVSDEYTMVEAIVGPNSRLIGRTAGNLSLRRRYGFNLLAIARQGRSLKNRLHKIALRAGDVLLVQGDAELLPDTLSKLGCLPLAERALKLGNPRRILMAVGIFGAAIVLAATGVLPITLAFTLAALVMLGVKLLSVREIYDGIDWPIIVLLGAMIPVGSALESTGAAQRIAEWLLVISSGQPGAVALVLLMVVTMGLSDIVNNAAAAVLMAPVAVGIAHGMGVSVDPFLMGVAVSASAAFLTPIGHQSNTLVMGPGGYEFGDYWKLGLPLELVVLGSAVPLILRVWPL